MAVDDATYLIEVKWADDSPSKHFSYFEPYFKNAKKIQLVKELKREKTFPNKLEIRDVVSWLATIDFGSRN